MGDLGGQKSETDPLGSVLGTPLEMAVQGKGGRWWGSAYKVAAVQGRVFNCTSGGGGFEVKIPKPSHVAQFWA